jgi:hypothetical protein
MTAREIVRTAAIGTEIETEIETAEMTVTNAWNPSKSCMRRPLWGERFCCALESTREVICRFRCLPNLVIDSQIMRGIGGETGTETGTERGRGTEIATETGTERGIEKGTVCEDDHRAMRTMAMKDTLTAREGEIVTIPPMSTTLGTMTDTRAPVVMTTLQALLEMTSAPLYPIHTHRSTVCRAMVSVLAPVLTTRNSSRKPMIRVVMVAVAPAPTDYSLRRRPHRAESACPLIATATRSWLRYPEIE